MTPFLASMLLGLSATGGLAWSLGGPAGVGVLAGGALGLALGAATTWRQRRLLATRPERALGAFVLGFLTKLLVLLSATVFFRLARLESVDPAAFVLSFLGAVLLSTAAGWLPSVEPRGAEALPR